MERKSKTRKYRLYCADCQKDVEEKVSVSRCPYCGGSLDIEYDYLKISKTFKKGTQSDDRASLWNKYADLLPVETGDNLVTIQEGDTHLYKAEALARLYGMKRLYLKNEGINPTGVFKDRGSVIEVTKAINMGAKAMIIASSGNMAASCAAYASKAGLRLYVLVPESTPVGKLAQILSYGAQVVKIRDDYSACVTLAEKLAAEYGFYQAGDYVFRREGQKTLSYELLEQTGWKVPDFIIVPAGAGTHLAGLWKGFREMKLVGAVKKLPAMIAVQPSGCKVIVRAYDSGKEVYVPAKRAETVCSAVAVTNPSDGRLALKAIYESGGSAVDVSDEKVLEAQKTIAQSEGIFVEPSSSLVVAALNKLKTKRIIKKEDFVVCVLTGNGLKDPMAALEGVIPPKTFEADYSVLKRYIKSIHR